MSRNRILLVDDDVLNHWLVTDCLNAVGFDVTGLCRGADAIEMLEAGQEFDLLFTDFQMPDGMNGFELAERWRQAQPGRPILYTSSYPNLVIGPLQDDEAYVRKHAKAPELLSIVAELLEEAELVGMHATGTRIRYVN